MKIKKEKEMSIKLRNNANKLIVQNPYISQKISGTLIGLSIPIVFMFYGFQMLSSVSYKMTLAKALDSARLVCHRNNVEITCSLTGAGLYGNIEKVFSTKNENLIQKVQVKAKLFHAEDDKDSLLVIIANKEEFFLYT